MMSYETLFLTGLALLLLSGQLAILSALEASRYTASARHADLASLAVLVLGLALTVYALARLLGLGS